MGLAVGSEYQGLNSRLALPALEVNTLSLNLKIKP